MHCSRCGSALRDAPPTECGSCGYLTFLNARPCAGAVVVRRTEFVSAEFVGAEFLAVRRAKDPGAGRWDLPGGFCDGDEHPAAAAVREVSEETGLAVRLGGFLGIYMDGYDFQGETFPTMNCYWLAEPVNAAAVPLATDPEETTELGWLPLAAPPKLAFPHEDDVLRDAARLLGRR